MTVPRVMLLNSALAGSLAAAPDWYAPFRSHNRVLLVFAPSESDRDLAAQRAALHPGSAGHAERDLVTIEVIGNHADDGRVGARTLRRAYGVAPCEFTVVLMGKDGGEKWRQRHPVTEAALFATIDAMPMRRNEMSRRTEPK